MAAAVLARRVCVTMAVGLVAGLASCSGTPPAENPPTSPFVELYDQGLTRYVGTPEVQPTDRAWFLGGIWEHRFEPEGRGPICMMGEPFELQTRAGDSTDLLIYFQGGGVCFDDFCMATVSPAPGLQSLSTGLIGLGGILDRTNALNPMAEFDVVHVPYCDASFFWGDVDRTFSDGNDENGAVDPAYQRGLLNMTAAFEVAKAEFPNPSRVVVAGLSGGAYAPILAVPLARRYFPDVEILAIADSGAPMLDEADPTFAARAITEVNAYDSMIPPSCVDCLEDGHLGRLIAWQLSRDPNLRYALLTHVDDFTLGEVYMRSPLAAWTSAMERIYGELEAEFGDRVSLFAVAGEHHSFLLDVTADPFVQQLIAEYMGPTDYLGEDAEAALAILGDRFYLGELAETGVDEYGIAVSASDFVTAYLEGPDVSFDVLSFP